MSYCLDNKQRKKWSYSHICNLFSHFAIFAVHLSTFKLVTTIIIRLSGLRSVTTTWFPVTSARLICPPPCGRNWPMGGLLVDWHVFYRTSARLLCDSLTNPARTCLNCPGLRTVSAHRVHHWTRVLPSASEWLHQQAGWSFGGEFPPSSALNGSGRFHARANVLGSTVRWQSGHRRSSRYRVSMVRQQGVGGQGGIWQASYTEIDRATGLGTGVTSSISRNFDLSRSRNRLWRAASGSRDQHSHAGRSRGWNHGALSYVPYRLC